VFLKRFGFQGDWVKNEDYLPDFDAAVRRWGKWTSEVMTRVNLRRNLEEFHAETSLDQFSDTWRLHENGPRNSHGLPAVSFAPNTRRNNKL
jgi:hypothetical protein